MITIAFIGCGKDKQHLSPSDMVPARELYTGDLFVKRVAHVEQRKLPWFILSAKSGLLKPSTHVRTYDQVLTDMPELDVAEWHVGVANQLFTALYYDFGCPALADVQIELHAGRKYCEPLATILRLFKIKILKPVEGLGIGQQKAYYVANTKVQDEPAVVPVPVQDVLPTNRRDRKPRTETAAVQTVQSVHPPKRSRKKPECPQASLSTGEDRRG